MLPEGIKAEAIAAPTRITFMSLLAVGRILADPLGFLQSIDRQTSAAVARTFRRRRYARLPFRRYDRLRREFDSRA